MEKTVSIYCNYAAALLASVLKGMQSVIRKTCSILNAIDSKYSTLMVRLVIPVFVTLTHFVRFYYIPGQAGDDVVFVIAGLTGNLTVILL